MAYHPKAWLVSALTSEEHQKKDEYFQDVYHNPQFDDLMQAVGEALRDVKFCRIGANTAVVYREGDTHALGEIGYKNTKSTGHGEPTYYVLSRRIKNEKYRDSNWQHNIISSKALKTAVKAASTYLVPFTCEEAVMVTRDVPRQVIAEAVGKFQSAARQAFKDLTGETGYGSNMHSEFMRELRHHVFISPDLNQKARTYYAAFDAWKEAEAATKNGVYFVGITDNYGQQVVDTARVDMSYPYKAECFDRMPAESVADWVKGRVAVLSMTPMQHYVSGVGLRLDDRIFYVVGETEEE